MLSSFFVSAAFLLDLASAHGRLTVPTTRLGNPARYENDPVQYPLKQFVCRNDKNSAVTPPVYTAGQVIQIEYLLSAPHVGDAAVYISYDGDEGFATRETMQFFKIANIPRARDSSGIPVSITLPAWLPAGQAVLRWEWYALHVNPKIELYAQCSDVVIVGTDAEVPLDTVPKYHVVDQSTYDPKTLPKANQGDIWDRNQVTLYRNAFDTGNYPQFMTGPECALGFTQNNCAETAVGSTGWIDMGVDNGPAPAPTTTQSPPTTTEATTTTQPPATTTEATTTTQTPPTTTDASTTTRPSVPTETPTIQPTESPVTPAPPAPTRSPVDAGQCGTTFWEGSTCTEATASCCPSGTACYAMNQWWSGCFRACQDGWLCSQPDDHPCPGRFSGAQCGGVNFSGGVDGCCADGFNCYKYNEWWSGCFEGPCPEGYEC